jgi:peptidoglycan/xylan/chitin deacetylase (PgdA/CDA1 family)
MPQDAVATTCPPRKEQVARALRLTRTLGVMASLERRRPSLRVLNLLGVPRRFESSFRTLLEYLLERYEPIDPFALERVLADGPIARPSVLLTFDDGLANHAESAAPILEEYGIRAVFCVPAEFLDLRLSEQLSWFRNRVYPHRTELHLDEDARAMTWGQVSELAARGHRICSHSTGHGRITATTPAEAVDREVVESRLRIEARVPGISVDGFCWPIQFDVRATAAEAVVRTTYRYALCGGARALRPPHDPYRVYRTNVEVSWSPDVVDLQLSWITDVRSAVREGRERRRA